MAKENCRSLTVISRVLPPGKGQSIASRFRKITHISDRNHVVLMKILKATNNPNISWKFRGKRNAAEQEAWEHKMSILNEKLIELGLIVTDHDLTEEENAR